VAEIKVRVETFEKQADLKIAERPFLNFLDTQLNIAVVTYSLLVMCAASY
jgi:hypothetical protein